MILHVASDWGNSMKRTQTGTDRWFNVVTETDDVQAAVMTLAPGDATGGSENKHASSDQWLYVIADEGRAMVESKMIDLTAGDLVVIEASETHEIEATGSERH